MATDAASREVEAALALLEAHLDVARQDLRVPGLSAAVVLDQDIVWSRGFGLADRAQEIHLCIEHLICEIVELEVIDAASGAGTPKR